MVLAVLRMCIASLIWRAPWLFPVVITCASLQLITWFCWSAWSKSHQRHFEDGHRPGWPKLSGQQNNNKMNLFYYIFQVILPLAHFLVYSAWHVIFNIFSKVAAYCRSISIDTPACRNFTVMWNTNIRHYDLGTKVFQNGKFCCEN